MHCRNLLWTPSTTPHEIFSENVQIFLKFQFLPILVHNLRFRQMLISLKSTQLSVNFDQSFSTSRQILRGAGIFLAIYKGFHFGMEQLLAQCAMAFTQFVCILNYPEMNSFQLEINLFGYGMNSFQVMAYFFPK